MIVDVLDDEGEHDGERDEDFIDIDSNAPSQEETDFHHQYLRKSAMCFVSMMIVLVFATTCLGVVISKRPSHEDGESEPKVYIEVEAPTNKSASDNWNNSIPKLPYPPPDITEKCAPNSVRTVPGYEECLSLCEPSACCELPSSDFFSCNQGNEDACTAYGALYINLNLRA